MKELSLRESQLAALNVLEQVDKICRKLDIKYYLMWGTLIGVIRHQGFIPWDDDLDIAMFKDDFNILKEYFITHKRECDPLYIDCYPDNDKCFFNIPRICDSTYKLLFNNMNYTSGMFIDVYVLEGLGNESDLAYWGKRFKKYSYYQKMIYMSSLKHIFYGSSMLHKIGNIPQCVIAKIVGKSHYMSAINSYKHFDINNCTYIGVPKWEKSIMRREWFSDTIEKTFEGNKFYIPIGYEEILRNAYGDYMKFPPESQRHPYHGYEAYRK